MADCQDQFFTSFQLQVVAAIVPDSQQGVHVTTKGGNNYYAEEFYSKRSSIPHGTLLVEGWRECKQLRMFNQSFSGALKYITSVV